MEWFTIIQVIGVLGFLSIVLSFQSNKRSKILTCLWIGNAFFALHFSLLGAWTAVAMNIIAAFRTFIFSYRERRTWADNRFWPYLFLALFWISGIKTFAGFYTLSPVVAQSIETFGLWARGTTTIRVVNLIPHPLWFIYNYLVGSIPGMFTEIFVFSSISIGIIRFDVMKKKEKGGENGHS